MKKSLVFFFVFLYVLSVSGASFNLHFCGNSLEQISFAGFGHKGCCCGKAMMKKDCCKDKQISFKSEKDQQRYESAGTIVCSTENTVTLLPEFHSFKDQFFISSIEIKYHSPPILDDDSGLFILNRVFRI